MRDQYDIVERERWVLLKIPRGDIDGVGEGKWRGEGDDDVYYYI